LPFGLFTPPNHKKIGGQRYVPVTVFDARKDNLK